MGHGKWHVLASYTHLQTHLCLRAARASLAAIMIYLQNPRSRCSDISQSKGDAGQVDQNR